MTKELKEKAINIKGKQYVLVSDRVLYFNENYLVPSIATSYELNNDMFIVKATVSYYDPEWKQRLTFTGHSQAIIGDGMVNKTAALENAETSAVGRALAMMGIGVIDSIASVDEINKATGSTGLKMATDKQIQWVRDTAARVYKLEDQAEIDKAIESVLTIPVTKIPLAKVKAAVDKIEADKEKVANLKLDDITLDSEEINLDDIPY